MSELRRFTANGILYVLEDGVIRGNGSPIGTYQIDSDGRNVTSLNLSHTGHFDQTKAKAFVDKLRSELGATRGFVENIPIYVGSGLFTYDKNNQFVPGTYTDEGVLRPRVDVLSEGLSDAEKAARDANEDRYNQIIGELSNLRGRAMNNANFSALQQLNDSARNFRSQASQARQNLVSRGLGNTTILPNVNQGFAEREQFDRNRIISDLNQQRNALDIDLTTRRLGVMERRNDIPPDLQNTLELFRLTGRIPGTTGG